MRRLVADPGERFAENVPGRWFVDRGCIDCDHCRALAPRLFAAAPGHSYVQLQPSRGSELALAEQAREECPVGAIGEEPGYALVGAPGGGGAGAACGRSLC